MEDQYANRAAKALADVQTQTGNACCGSVGRQSTKAMLLEGVERLRKEANQLEALAYQVDRVTGDADQMLYRMLLSAHIHR